MLGFLEQKEQNIADPLEQFYKQAFPIGNLDEDKFDGPKLNSKVTRTYIYNGDRSAKMKQIASKYRKPVNDIRVEYVADAPGSSVGRLLVFQNGIKVQTIFLKPNVKISTNFNAMLTELLPIAMFKCKTNRLLVNGNLTEQVKESIYSIIDSPERAKKIINQIDQNIEFVKRKEDEILRIRSFYANALSKSGAWKDDITDEAVEWLGQSKIDKNYGYVDRADVQLTYKCRVSLKSVTPTDVMQPIFLCNSTFKSFMRDMMAKTGIHHTDEEDFIPIVARKLGASRYGELLMKFLNKILRDKTYNTYIVLHYILGDYCRKVRADGTGYNHILMTCAGHEPYELRADDGFVREAMNRNPRFSARVYPDGDKYYLAFGDGQYLDISFKDKPIVPNDHANNLKFKILEKFKT